MTDRPRIVLPNGAGGTPRQSMQILCRTIVLDLFDEYVRTPKSWLWGVLLPLLPPRAARNNGRHNVTLG